MAGGGGRRLRGALRFVGVAGYWVLGFTGWVGRRVSSVDGLAGPAVRVTVVQCYYNSLGFGTS